MNPTQSDVHVNVPLSNISIAFIQSQDKFIAAKVFPAIPVSKQGDRYYTYERGDFNRDEMEERAPATESAGGGYTLDNTPTYYARRYSLHKDIDDETRTNQDSVLDADRDATQYLTQKGLIKRERLWAATYFTTSVWTWERAGVDSSPSAGSSVLRWNDANSTPIEDIRMAKRAVAESTGFEPNVLSLGRAVYDALVDHPDIIDRLDSGQTPGGPALATREKLAAIFEVEEVVVMNAIVNTAKKGQTAVHSFIGGKHALLSYRPKTPGLLVPSAGYTFNWTGLLGSSGSGFRIRSFRMEHLTADRVEIDAAYDQKKVAADLGAFFYTIVA